MDRLYVGMAREVFAQNEMMLMECRNDQVHVYTEYCQDLRYENASRREKDQLDGAFCAPGTRKRQERC